MTFFWRARPTGITATPPKTLQLLWLTMISFKPSNHSSSPPFSLSSHSLSTRPPPPIPLFPRVFTSPPPLQNNHPPPHDMNNNSKITHRHPSSAAKFLPLIYDHHKPWWNQILDPGSEFVNQWNHIFLVTCLFALFLDPLYFFLPVIGGRVCMTIDLGLSVLITLIRSVVDLFSVLHMAMKFRTAYVAPSSRVFGRGELVTDPKMIAVRYLKTDFIIDLAAALPLPQVICAVLCLSGFLV